MCDLIENLVERKGDKLHKRHILFVADEVHEMGTEKRIEKFNLFDPEYRLGLSATPKRYFDEEGTDFILEYFRGNFYEDGIIYEYNLSDAIRDGFLCPYDYFTIKCTLNQKETEEYNELTKKIIIERKKEEPDENRIFRLLFNRKAIINKASCKKEKILSLISDLKEQEQLRGLKYVLVYLEDTDQLMEIYDELVNQDYRVNYIIQDTKNRNEILERFKTGEIQILLAIDILDQGINVPELSIGIISSSTGNEKQFIQRRGRLLRIHTQSGKDKALIYDLVVPYIDSNKVEGEFERMRIFYEDCSNKEDHDWV